MHFTSLGLHQRVGQTSHCSSVKRFSSFVGPDEMHLRFLKELVNVIVNPLSIYSNLLLTHGKLPRDWMNAMANPVFKCSVLQPEKITID